MDIFVIIFWIASIVVLLLAALVGVLGGLRRGALRGAVKLLALVVSVALTVVIAICLRGVAVDTLIGFVPEELQDYEEIVAFAMNIPASVALLIAFWPIFTVVRLLMLIPQKLICKILPRTFDELVTPKKQKADRQTKQTVPAPAIEEESPIPAIAEEESAPAEEIAEAAVEPDAVTPEEAAIESDSVTSEKVAVATDPTAPAEEIVEDAPAVTPEEVALSEQPLVAEATMPVPEAEVEVPVEEISATATAEEPVIAPVRGRVWKKILWYTGAVVCGVLSSVLMVGAVIMPVSCLITRASDSLSRITAVMAEENFGEYSEEISEVSHSVAVSPLLATTDFFYGKTVFEPLTGFSTEYGRINLSKEIDNLTTIACDVLPVYIHISEDGELAPKDDDHLVDAVNRIADSDFLLNVGALAVQFAAEDLNLFDDSKEMTPGKEALEESLTEVLEDTTPETLAEHLELCADLISAVGDSSILEALTKEDKEEMKIADFADKEALGEVFGILYDDDAVRELLVPVINFGAETVFKEIGMTPVYSTADLDDYSRKEVVAEAEVLCDAILGMAEFAESMEESGDNLSAYRLSGAGKALDCLKKSILFGACYDELVQALTTMNIGSDGETDQLMSSLGDALQKSDSAEKLMNSAQSVLVMNEQLEKGEKKGSENQELVSSLDTLLNDTNANDSQILADLADDVFAGREDGIGNDQKTEMIQDCVKALNAVSAQGNADPAVEADAVQVIYNLTHSNANAFEDVTEKEAVDAMLESKLAMEMVNNLNAEGRDYGVRSKMDAENKTNILAALAESNADQASKNSIAKFFGVQ